MGKKLIFIGPPGAGKTTIKKIIFEGENSKKLLDYALEPTYGEDSLIFRLSKLNEELAIYDLAGQENKRWFSEDHSIFQNTNIILVVLDINSGTEKIVNFINKVIKLKEEKSLTTEIVVLIHKIDLVSEIELQEMKTTLLTHFKDKTILTFLFTSIKKEFFAETFSFFLDLLKQCFKDEFSSKITDSDNLRISLEILYLINQELFLTVEDLQSKLKIPKSKINDITERLISKSQIKYDLESGKKVFSLTRTAKENLNKLTENIYLKRILNVPKIKIARSESFEYQHFQIIGFFIADKDGKTFLHVELFENALKQFMAEQETKYGGENIHIDVELIPMFISALEKFSSELNIQNLSDFNLRGDNLKMEVINFHDYTITFFSNPSVEFKLIQKDIEEYFLNFFDEYRRELELFEKSGASCDKTIITKAKKWLEDLNEKYNNLILNFSIIDTKEMQKFYNEIDSIQERISLKTSITLKKLKKIKVNLLKAIMDEDKGEVRNIVEKINKIKVRYSI